MNSNLAMFNCSLAVSADEGIPSCSERSGACNGASFCERSVRAISRTRLSHRSCGRVAAISTSSAGAMLAVGCFEVSVPRATSVVVGLGTSTTGGRVGFCWQPASANKPMIRPVRMASFRAGLSSRNNVDVPQCLKFNRPPLYHLRSMLWQRQSDIRAIYRDVRCRS